MKIILKEAKLTRKSKVRMCADTAKPLVVVEAIDGVNSAEVSHEAGTAVVELSEYRTKF